MTSQKKSSFGNFFPANQHGKSTADQLLMSQNCPKIFASIWWPVRNPSEISESFEKISTANQQQINRAITELDFFWDINTANGDMGYVDYDYYILLPSKIEYQQLLI